MNHRTLIRSFLQAFIETGVVEVVEEDETFHIKFLKAPKKKAPAPTGLFDLEALYKLYPLKKGKAKGMAKLQKLVKTEGDYERIKNCIIAYGASVRGSDPRYIQHFSTFINGTWQDYELLPGEGQSGSLENDDYLLILQGVGLHLKFEPHLSKIKEVFPEYEQFRAFLAKTKEFFNTHSDSEVDREKFRATLSKAIKGEIGVRD